MIHHLTANQGGGLALGNFSIKLNYQPTNERCVLFISHKIWSKVAFGTEEKTGCRDAEGHAEQHAHLCAREGQLCFLHVSLNIQTAKLQFC